MNNFIFHTPTKIYFGKAEYQKVGEVLKQYGATKVMIQYGKQSVKSSGLLEKVISCLKSQNISYLEVSGVEPNPKLSFIRKATELAISEKVDFILAIGGGSVIDSCKFTALSAYNNCDAWDFISGKVTPKGAIPLAVILTISAAGSEMSSSAVLTNEELNIKKGFTTEYNRPTVSFLSPELTYSVSAYQTACGIVDIMAHTLERYFTCVEDTPLTDGICEALLKTVIDSGKLALIEPNNYNARANLMWASSLSHNNLTGAGRENYLAVHQLEHALSGIFDNVAHGAGLAVLLPSWARYVYKKNVKRFSSFARNVWNVLEKDDEKASIIGIEKMQEYFKGLGLETRLRDFGVKENDLQNLALNCTRNKTITVKSYISLGFKEVLDIFKLCF